jgi:hypothetical protein
MNGEYVWILRGLFKDTGLTFAFGSRITMKKFDLPVFRSKMLRQSLIASYDNGENYVPIVITY